MLSSGPYYVRFNRDRIWIRDVSSGEAFECSAKVSVDDRNQILSVGDPIHPTAVETRRPFDHPRIVVADYTAGEAILRYAVHELAGRRHISPSPILVIHPDMQLDGGLTAIEERALREMADGSGARKVFVHEGAILTDQEVNSIASGG